MNLNLTAKQRGYRTPGAKLAPRDSYDAALIAHMGVRSMRAMRRENAIEMAALGADARPMRPHHKRQLNAERRLSRRDQRQANRFLDLYDMRKLASWFKVGQTRLTQAQTRYINAVIDAWMTEEMIDYDRKLLANAY